MKGKEQQLKPDIVLKNYWQNNEHFADFFNAVLFDGEQVIKPDELENKDTEASYISEHRSYTESIGASRDMIKVHKHSLAQDVELVLLGMESQEYVHYAMPMRVMGYDYSAYKKQYEINAQKYKGNKFLQGDEYLSKMKKEDKFIPVITVVVYYGEKPWDGAVSLREMLNIPQQMKKFVNDYKMRLVEARQSNLVLHNMNNQDMFNLLEILLDKNSPLNETKNKAIEYTREHDVDKHVIMAVAGATRCKIDYNDLSRGGDMDMCTVFEETWSQGRETGKAEGILEGRAEGIIEIGLDCGLTEDEIIAKLQMKLGISQQKAQGYFDLFTKHTVQA